MSVLKLVSLLFPFVRDMILGESSLAYAFKTNKRRVLLLALLMFCFGWTVYSIPRLVELATEQVRLEHRYQQLEALHTGTSEGEAKPINPASQATGHVIASATATNAPLPDVPTTPEPTLPAVIPGNNASDFQARQRAWLSSLGDTSSRQ